MHKLSLLVHSLLSFLHAHTSGGKRSHALEMYTHIKTLTHTHTHTQNPTRWHVMLVTWSGACQRAGEGVKAQGLQRAGREEAKRGWRESEKRGDMWIRYKKKLKKRRKSPAAKWDKDINSRAAMEIVGKGSEGSACTCVAVALCL